MDSCARSAPPFPPSDLRLIRKRLGAGALFAASVAGAALRARALTRDGALAAFAVGTLTYGAGGWAFALILLAFFGPAVALSRVGRARKKLLTDIGKGGARDAWQVLANGGVATVCAVAYAVRPVARPRLRRAWVAAFAGSYAAATADTWGTEIGTLVRGAPRSILTLKRIPTGLSGGVTVAGSVAEVAGAVWSALCAISASRLLPESPPPVRGPQPNRGKLFWATVTGGIAGALVDSLLGATAQELRYCPVCERNCETNPHGCGTPTVLVRGIPSFSNDLVNFAATLTGAIVGFTIAEVN
jgi:uncharacterized protein (TIGR00297 family)